MRIDGRQFGLTLLEMLVALTVILILIGSMGGLGVHLKKQSEIRLTESTIDVLVTAIEQFYDSASPGTFPFVTRNLDLPPDGLDGIAHEYTYVELQIDLTENGIQADILGTGIHQDSYASSEALFYFLNRNPKSAPIIDTLMDRMVTSKDANGAVLTILIGGPVAGGGRIEELSRFVDTWGTPIRYEYDPNVDTFPILTSAGPDKIFKSSVYNSPDDISNQ